MNNIHTVIMDFTWLHYFTHESFVRFRQALVYLKHSCQWFDKVYLEAFPSAFSCISAEETCSVVMEMAQLSLHDLRCYQQFNHYL